MARLSPYRFVPENFKKIDYKKIILYKLVKCIVLNADKLKVSESSCINSNSNAGNLLYTMIHQLNFELFFYFSTLLF